MLKQTTVRITGLKLPYNHAPAELEKAVLKKLQAKSGDIVEIRIARKSLDARNNRLHVIYTIDASVHDFSSFAAITAADANIARYEESGYHFPFSKNRPKQRPVIAGAGPAGLFCALVLAENGFRPLVLERGQNTEQRTKTVDAFWNEGRLDPDSNVQFGEGGAGTFSDGKLNTGIKDKSGRLEKVLKSFVGFGAPEDILISNKPHIGTDYLKTAVVNMRKKIEALGGEFRFSSCVTDIIVKDDSLKAIEINRGETLACTCLVLAVGHSARDTYAMLQAKSVPMEAKVFAVGIRIEHPQKFIDKVQYGDAADRYDLPAADYKLADKTKDGRGVYTFCMCPGGYVVNAASEGETCVTNGMSYYSRDSRNANSAVLVNVYPADFHSGDLLAGVRFQQELEKKAWALGGRSYALPVQRFEDFAAQRTGNAFGSVVPCTKGTTAFADLNRLFPGFISNGIREGITAFGRKLKGFDHADALLTGPESRSSSPLRILRDENFQSAVEGIFPCGEGAGYAGGIMSAAIDGIKTAERIASFIS